MQGMQLLRPAQGRPQIDKAGPSTFSWIVPKDVVVGDDVVIYVGGLDSSQLPTSIPRAEPRSDWNRYGASLAHVTLIRPPISLGAIRRNIPMLTWAIYPRSITTPAPRIAGQIRHLSCVGVKLASQNWTKNH
jgi:hypothetical protein